MSAERSARWVRRWVAVYTRGLPAEVRRDRRDEIEDDLWAQMHEGETSGRTDRSLAGEIVTRLLFGIPADISWRVEQRGPDPKRVPPDLDPTLGIRFTALFAVLGGVGWVVWPIPQAVYGDAGWSEGGVPWLLFISVVLGTWALAAAMLGLVIGFQEWIRGGAAFIGVLGATVGAYSVFGLFGGIVALLVGSAVLVWELGRAGVLSVRQSRAHAATAVIWVVTIVLIFANIATFNGNAIGAALAALFLLPYGFSWIAIGWSLRRGAPMPESPAEGPS
jgi:hypothetical protein